MHGKSNQGDDSADNGNLGFKLAIAYFEDSAIPRYFNIGAMLGSAPSQAAYILARSSVLPRESIIRRKRSPFARVKPP